MRMRKKKHGDLRLQKCDSLLIKDKSEIPNVPLQIEIGCGKGRFICETAKRNPDSFFIAVELIPDVIVLAMEKAIKEGLTNIRFILGDAQSLEEYFDAGTIERIYLNFSDPWPKLGHCKRRLTYRSFLEIYRRLLVPTGEIVFKTDNRPLFDFSLEEFKYMGFTLSDLTYDLHKSEYNKDNIVTEYEENFSNKGFTINRVRAGMNDTTNLKVVPADITELDRIMEIICQAQAYMAQNGIPQWNNGYPSRELIEAEIGKGSRYVVKKGDDIVATVGYFTGPEAEYEKIYDGQWINENPYLSIHRICVDNSFKGMGIGGAMVRGAEELARNSKIRNLRCDTHEVNTSMRRMLEKNGFVHCGTIHLADGSPRVAYQKKMR